MGSELFPHLTNSAGIGNWSDIRKSGLSMNARKEKGAEARMASEFATTDNY